MLLVLQVIACAEAALAVDNLRKFQPIQGLPYKAYREPLTHYRGSGSNPLQGLENL